MVESLSINLHDNNNTINNDTCNTNFGPEWSESSGDHEMMKLSGIELSDMLSLISRA